MCTVPAELCAKNGVLRPQPLPSFHYMSKNLDNVEDSKHLFTMHELPSGYNFIPLNQEPAEDPETNDLDAIVRWKKATFQGRSVDFFEHDGKKYGVAIAVDGQDLRSKHYTGLNRKGD